MSKNKRNKNICKRNDTQADEFTDINVRIVQPSQQRANQQQDEGIISNEGDDEDSKFEIDNY